MSRWCESWAALCVVMSSLWWPCAAQEAMDWGVSLREQEIWKFLSEAVESTRCSEQGARAIQAHLESHGLPWSVEAAWNIEGLSKEEQRWLIGTETWRKWVERRVASNQEGPIPWSFSATRESRHVLGGQVSIHEFRSRAGGLRVRFRHQDSLQVGGSWMQSRGGWHGAVGDHGLAWGHGLTVPRADMFGLALFLGDAEMRMHNPPRGLIHSDFEGGLRGLALERQSRRTKLGVTLGTGHLGALVMSTFRQHEWGWTLYKTGSDLSFGPHWTAQIGAMHIQCAGALFNDGTAAFRTSWRLARSRSWVTQAALDMERREEQWMALFRGYATWMDPQSGKGLQVRWRRRGPRTWDVRAKGVPSKGAFWNWSFVGNEETTLVGVHAKAKGLRCTWWLGCALDGSWSEARHVESVWRVNDRCSVGFVGMEGRGEVSDAFVMVPALDSRRWSRLPPRGQRMGLWCAMKHEGHGWTTQWTWSPSQQEAFRCALRWRWDA